MQKRKEQISGSFNEETAKQIRAYAKAIDRSLADSIRIMVEHYLKQKGYLK